MEAEPFLNEVNASIRKGILEGDKWHNGEGVNDDMVVINGPSVFKEKYDGGRVWKESIPNKGNNGNFEKDNKEGSSLHTKMLEDDTEMVDVIQSNKVVMGKNISNKMVVGPKV